MEPTYDQILPMLVRAELDGSSMYCEFAVPGSGEVIASSAPVRRSDSLQSQVSRVVSRNVNMEVRRTASRLLRQALGGGFVGRTASSILNTSMRGNQVMSGYTEEEKQAAVVEAYRRVANQLQPAQQAQRSSISIRPKQQQLSEFEQQLRDAPVTERFDQEILVRMLAELASSDGSISDEEREFLDSFIPPALGSIDQYLNGDPISPVECDEVSSKARPTIYLIAAALSVIDFSPRPAEQSLLMEFGEMFGLKDRTIEELNRTARYYVLEQAISPETPRQELFDLAQTIQLSQDDALRCQIQLKKRQG
ncbi:MAG: hypothetical protein NW241_22095 [Bacteroidia bacterium]|nr:hypothetical protein [Bacteroidia bacterium]